MPVYNKRGILLLPKVIVLNPKDGNSVILIAALIPWAIAGAVPVATIGAEMTCLVAAFYLYLVPLWNLCFSIYTARRKMV